MANDGEWRTVQYVVEGVKVIHVGYTSNGYIIVGPTFKTV